MSKVKIALILLMSGFVLTGCSLLSSSSTPDPDSNECFGIGKEIAGIADLEAIIVPVGDANDYLEQKEFTLAELDGLQFGMTGLKGDVEYFGTYELCNLDTGEVLSEGEFVEEPYTQFEVKSNPGAVSEGSGNSTGFKYTSNDVETNHITEPGNYAVYTFSSVETDVWELSDSYEFTVVE